ncbi:MAG: hypothetical protein WBM99_12910 [Psychromonas sp.]
MKSFILSLSIAACISGCSSLKPVELPQKPFGFDAKKSTALNYFNAMGLHGAIDLPKGKAETLLKERQKSVIESGLESSLKGYVLSFAFATALGLPPTVANDLAKDTAEDQFILGAGTAKNQTQTGGMYDSITLYLPYEKAKDKESARLYVFNHFVSILQSMDMKLEDINSELKYGLGKQFTHPLCEELDTECRYQISLKDPVLAYAPELMGGYKAWVWSTASQNSLFIRISQTATWSDLATFNMSKIKDNELKVQDAFFKPLVHNYPDWSVVYREATYNEAPKIIVGGDETFRFETPQP